MVHRERVHIFQFSNNFLCACLYSCDIVNRLYTRDPHQLFELLCIQLRCISIAYSDGLKQMLKTNGADESPTYNPVELLTCKWNFWAVCLLLISCSVVHFVEIGLD